MVPEQDSSIYTTTISLRYAVTGLAYIMTSWERADCFVFFVLMLTFSVINLHTH